MARIGVRPPAVPAVPRPRRARRALTALLALSTAALALGGCGREETAGEGDPGTVTVVATTTWEGAFARAAGAKDVKVLVPPSTGHAPDYEPKPSDLTTVAAADFVLYAPFEPYAEQIKDAAGSQAELVEVGLDNDAAKVRAEVTRLAALFGTEDAAADWRKRFDAHYARLEKELKADWPDGKRPKVVSQVFTTWAAKLAGARTVGAFGPEAVTPEQLSRLSAHEPALVLDNAHMTTGEVLPGTDARQVDVVNYPDRDLDLLAVYEDAATALSEAMTAS
ncbi:zinc ABC transporter substrate-binding protein [Streptomyces sp. NPDC002490]|uniref:metal ABC transporter solute-binding protein, Zn/Mn family n=1 Tax=Streptomyces sp. NPDC002490 TaxID=3154416 RepID=UPI0033203CE1